MKVIKLAGGESSLLLAFDGFGGSPERSSAIGFRPENCAVWYVYDYTTEEFPCEELRMFDTVYLVAWSLGVWQAARTLAGVRLAAAAAFNGTLEPVDAAFGIAPELFRATIGNWSEAARVKFNRRCGIPAEYASKRPAEEERAELEMLEMRVRECPEVKNIYHSVFCGENDRIFPLENQQRSWRKHGIEPVVLDAPHYVWNLAESGKTWINN